MSILRSYCFVLTFLALALIGGSAAAQFDITQPGDLIELVDGTNDGDANAGPPPGAEGVENAINNVTQKYLNFLDLGSGFKVTPSLGDTIVTALRFYTANDAIERDPASYVFEGSNDGTNFTTIGSGSLELPAGRNPGGQIAIDPALQFHQTVSFVNTTAYSSYRVTFPTLKNAGAANSMQIAEVELLGVEEGTLIGDADGNGVIDLLDFDLIRNNFRRTVAAGEDGDVNFSGNVDFDDFRLWKTAFSGGGPANVPEPSALALIGIGCVGLFVARRVRARG